MFANRPLFQQTGLKKSGKRTVWGLLKGLGRLHMQHFWRSVSSYKSAPTYWKKDFPDESNSKKFGDLRHFYKCDLELYKQLLKIQDQNRSFKTKSGG
jgi:hypothetical protein